MSLETYEFSLRHTHTHTLTKRGYPVLISFHSFFPTTSKTVDFVKFSFENVNTLLCVRVCLTLWVYYLFYTSFWLHICFLWCVCVKVNDCGGLFLVCKDISRHWCSFLFLVMKNNIKMGISFIWSFFTSTCTLFHVFTFSSMLLVCEKFNIAQLEGKHSVLSEKGKYFTLQGELLSSIFCGNCE